MWKVSRSPNTARRAQFFNNFQVHQATFKFTQAPFNRFKVASTSSGARVVVVFRGCNGTIMLSYMLVYARAVGLLALKASFKKLPARSENDYLKVVERSSVET